MWGFFRYFFPTYENDNLLCALEDDEFDEDVGKVNFNSPSECNVIIAEDVPVPNNEVKQIIFSELVQNE